ncbi:MAG: proton-conducting transporter membrane subunit [bacterium]
MTFSGGLVLFLLILGLVVCPKKLLKTYAPLALLGVSLYHWFIPQAGSFSFKFMGFGLELFHFRWSGYLIGLIISFFAFTYFIYEWASNHSRYFYIFAFIHVASALSLLFVNDFLSFFIFWELLTISAVVLIFIDSSPSKLIKKYFIYQLFGTILLFAGIAINYSVRGDIMLTPVLESYFFFLPAVFIKAAVIPFHSWLPSTYPRVSRGLTIFLSAHVTKMGVFSILVLLPGLSLELFGGLVALGAVLMALAQDKLRDFLSYHLISQVGYMIAGLSGATGLAVVGGVYHLVNNIVYKGLLFMIVGIIAVELDSEKISGEGGWQLTRRYPLLFAVALIASASISGLPPFNGYISKKLIIGGLESYPAVVLLRLASFGTGLSFVKFIYNCFLKTADSKEITGNGSFDPGKKIAVSILGLVCLVMGLFPSFLLSGTVGAQFSFYSLPAISKGLLPGLLAVFVFITLFDKFNYLNNLVTVDRFNIVGYFRPAWNYILNQLRQSHRGNLQHYIFWLFMFLLICWLYFYSQLGGVM